MKRFRWGLLLSVAALPGLLWAASDATADPLAQQESGVIGPLMAAHHIPGMAVGLVFDGHERIFVHGVASKQTQGAVSAGTLFEVGSLSKTFTATLASELQRDHRLDWSAPVGRYLPELEGTVFGSTPLLALATHTSGGLPLQVPDAVTDEPGLLRYLVGWRPTYAPASHRTYSNVGVGLLGVIAARTLHADFATEMDTHLFPSLGLSHTCIDPRRAGPAYAQGYAADGTPCRLREGVVWAPTYGVKTTVSDFLRWVELNMGVKSAGPRLDRAIRATHTGYFQAGPMTQDLIWEQYPMPVRMESLIEGNSQRMIEQATPVTALPSPLAPRGDVWINKTGSTRGFGAYVAFVPSQGVGIVLLANTNYPIEDRVRAAYQILLPLLREGGAQP